MHDINFFLQVTNYDKTDIVSYKIIHQGYTNKNFLIKTNDYKTYILRIPLKINDFVNEWNAYCNYQKIKFIYFDLTTGVYIKQFLIAEHPNLKNSQTLKLIIEELKIVHNKKLDYPIKKHNWLEWIQYNELDSNILMFFYKIIDQIKDDKKTLTHHDINAANILCINKQVFLIDWEWARLDSPYFDFATLALDDNVDEKLLIIYANLDYVKLNKYKFIILVFSHMWCIYMNTKKTRDLKNEIFIKIKKMMAKML